MNPSARIIPGNAFILTFAYKGGWTGGPLQDDIWNALATWAPFSSGKLTLLDVLSGSNSIVLTIQANAGADIFTFGGIGAAVRDTLNQAVPGWDLALTGLNAVGEAEIPGTGSTDFLTQFHQAGGVTFTPWAPPTPHGEPSWIPLALLVAAAGAVLFIVRK